LETHSQYQVFYLFIIINLISSRNKLRSIS